VLCHVLLLAVIGLTALSAVSCRSQRSVESLQESSAVRIETGRIEYETLETAVLAVPGDSVSLTIPMEKIQNLPEGATFTKKQGRTRVSLKLRNGAVVAEAETDSTAQVASRYERKARDNLKQCEERHERQSEERRYTGSSWNWWFWLSLAPLLILLVIIVSEIRKVFK